VLWLQTSARGVGGGGSPAEGVKSAAAAGFVRRAGAAASHGNVVSWVRDEGYRVERRDGGGERGK
jgi:hypothetical protein